MKLVKASIEYVDVITDPMKAIELAGRTCYKSEDQITEGSAEKFVRMLVDRGHHAMIEHGNFILQIGNEMYEEILKVEDRQYIRMSNDQKSLGCLISGNPKAFIDFLLQPYGVDRGIQRALAYELCTYMPILFQEMLEDHLSAPGDWEGALVYSIHRGSTELSVGEKLKHYVASYRVVCNRGVTHEIVRHRPYSYAQESTRYCNYKGGVGFIIPLWATNIKPCSDGDLFTNINNWTEEESKWIDHKLECEEIYKYMLSRGQRPQDARDNLPIATKTEIVITGNLLEWKHFFKMRCTPSRAPKDDLVNGIWHNATAPHPQMQEVANMMLSDMKVRIPVVFPKDYVHDNG